MTDRVPLDFWEQRYGGTERVWSGRVNATLATIVEGLEPGRALDLGCGEGGDAIWLAENGWHTTGVDLSPTAIARARQAATARGLGERTRFVAADLSAYSDAESYDLVTASFLQSPVALPRERILHAATRLVTPGGRMLVVAHAAAPAWAPPQPAPHMIFPTPESDLTALQLDPQRWRTLIAEVKERATTAPDGTPAVLHDSVVMVQRMS